MLKLCDSHTTLVPDCELNYRKSKKKKKPAGENWLLVDSRGENLYMDGDWG